MFEQLFAKRAEQVKPSLERMKTAYPLLGFPGKDTPSILIGGTNGKGSTAGFLWSLLATQYSNVGLYSSPHLVRFSERYCFSHRNFDDTDVLNQAKQIEAQLPKELYQQLSFFEVATLIAMQAFEREGNDFNIYEVGMGGTWDATNIVEASCSVIVSVSLDHQKFLGNTIAEIASEKAGIIKEGKPVFLGSFFASKDGEEARQVICQVAESKNAAVFLTGTRSLEESGDFLRLSDYFRPLWQRSAVLKDNFLLAYQVFNHLVGDQPMAQLDDKMMKIPETLTGRYQPLILRNWDNKELILDVCHNTAGVEKLAQHVLESFSAKTLPALICILADKDINPMLDLLRGIFAPIVLFKIKHERSFDTDDLAAQHSHLEVHDSFEDAWRKVISSWDHSVPWVVCGSVAAVGEVIEYFSADKNLADEFVLAGVDPTR